MSDYADRLAATQDAWDEADTSNQNEMPPDGDYQAIVERFDFIDVEKGKRPGLKLLTELKVLSPAEHEGHPITLWHSLEDPDTIKWTKLHLEKMGLDVDAETFVFSELEDYLGNLLDVPVEVAVKTKGGYSNAYVNGRLGPPMRSQEASDVPADTEGLVEKEDPNADHPFND